ncbi:MAG: hypothetical protein J7K68_01790 [Candidatus Diapherotrites archaeon]|nr:hypothetical protein [Candidatus Diapherotrites archaeon]
MKRHILLSIILFAACAMAVNYTEWQFSVTSYGAGTPDVQPSVIYDNGVIFKVESTTTSRAVWRLYTTIPYPGTGAFEVSFEAKVDAPGIDLDNDKVYTSGADDGDNMDGPNLFSYVYAGNSLTPDSPGFDPTSFSFWNFPSSTTKLCHVHRECNFFGPTDGMFADCDSAGTTMYQGWIFDADSPTNFGRVHEYNAPAFQNNEWKEITLNIHEGDCADANLTNYKYVTIAIQGIDFTGSYPFTWWIRNVKISYAGEEETLPLDVVYYGDTELHAPNYCGDGKKAGNEECDGTDGVPEGYRCTSNCMLETVCGDGIIAGDEVCDGIHVTEGYECSDDCKSEIPICGDNIVVEGELCDGTQVTPGFLCSDDCKSEIPICGDGIVVGTEECDLTNGTDENHLCRSDCKLYRKLNEKETEMAETIMDHMAQSIIGKPSLDEVTFDGPASITIKDLEDQIFVRNLTQFNGTAIQFCSDEIGPCEEKYIIPDTLLLAPDTLYIPEETKGLLKIYLSEYNGSQTYFIGFKPNPPSLIPKLSFTTWLIIGAIVFLLLVAGFILILVLGGFIYIKKFRKRR